MKVQNKKVVIGIITSLVLVSSISVLAPIIVHYANSYSKNSLLLTAANNYSTRKLSNNKYSESTNTLINNLTYINKYINSTLIVKEKLLKLSILGGKYDNSKKYKDDKNRKMSELARFSHTLKHVHRYGDQARATIDNSTTSLNKESSVISQIIPIIKDHPYTYNSYLNEMKISIPNISFFINNDLSSSNNLNSKTSDISNSSYGISTSNANMNSITFSSEEDGTGAKTMLAAGSGVYAAAFTKITFQAQIIIFSKASNSFGYETPTAKENTSSVTTASKQLDSKNSAISSINSLKADNLSYFKKNRTILSDLNSSLNAKKTDLPYPENPSYLPNYFNKELLYAAEVKVQYNHISSFKHNNSLYYPWIFSSLLIFGIPLGTVLILATRYKYKKLKTSRADYANDLDLRLSQLEEQIKNPPESESDTSYTVYINKTNDSILSIRSDAINNSLTDSERTRILKRNDDALADYSNKTLPRREILFLKVPEAMTNEEVLVNNLVPTPPPHTPPQTPPSRRRNNSDTSNHELDVRAGKQSRRVDNIDAAITNYNNEKANISGQIDKLDSQNDLNKFIRKEKTIFVGMISELKREHYVSVDEATRLTGKIQNILDELTNIAETRSEQIKFAKDAADQKVLNDAILSRTKNKNNTIIAIETRTTQIDALSNGTMQNETQLEESTALIHTQIDAIINDISKKDYNPDDLQELNMQALNLHTLLERKADAVRFALRESHRAEIQEIIDIHNQSIDKLGKISKKDKLHNQARKLREQITGIRESLDNSVFNPQVLTQLNKNIDALYTNIDVIVSQTNNNILNKQILDSAKLKVETQFAEIDKRIRDASSKNYFKTVESAADFVSQTEREHILPLVDTVKNLAAVLGNANLRMYHEHVIRLRINNKQLYETKKNDFVKNNDAMKALLAIKKDEIVSCEKIIKTKKFPSGNKAGKKSLEKQETTRTKLTREVEGMTLQIDLNQKVETEFSRFKFEDGLVNILDHV